MSDRYSIFDFTFPEYVKMKPTSFKLVYVNLFQFHHHGHPDPTRARKHYVILSDRANIAVSALVLKYSLCYEMYKTIGCPFLSIDSLCAELGIGILFRGRQTPVYLTQSIIRHFWQHSYSFSKNWINRHTHICTCLQPAANAAVLLNCATPSQPHFNFSVPYCYFFRIWYGAYEYRSFH